ncbi:DUF3631 domain-containing protein [Ensifer sp. MJa1]|uniref:DUF3631 domain-containing protein n=1 Tax=Ensifer sp. MJa1 TaxID=2919888 RepID=UPI00300808F0
MTQPEYTDEEPKVEDAGTFWKRLKERGINTDNVIQIPVTWHHEYLAKRQIVASGARLDALMDKARAFMEARLFMSADNLDLLTLWATATHAAPVASFRPILALTSSGPGSGKSTVLKMVAALTPNSFLQESITPPALYRHVEAANKGGVRPTMLLDEVDTYFKRHDDMKNTLNAAFEEGGKRIVSEKGTNDNYVNVTHRIDATFAVAGIGVDWVWPALQDRAFMVHMVKLRSGTMPPQSWVSGRDKPQLEGLAKQIGAIVKAGLDGLRTAQVDVEMSDGIIGRDRDKWRMMIAVADMAGGRWPKRARELALLISGPDDEAAERDEQERKLLRAIRVAFDEAATDRITASDLISSLRARGVDLAPTVGGDTPHVTADGKYLRTKLKPYAIPNKKLRFGDKVVHGYDRAWFEQAWRGL